MPDPTDDAIRFGDWLDTDEPSPPRDNLTGFTGRILREAALPEQASMHLSHNQRDRIRDRVFGGGLEQSKARTPVTTHVFAANGTTPTTLPTQKQDRPSASGLSILMTAALVAIIGIASFGLFRDSFDFLPNGSEGNPSGAPGIAYTPDATPLPSSSCDLTNDIPVVTSLDVIPWDRTVLLFSDNTLSLHCDGNVTEIAEGVGDVYDTPWPGTFTAMMEDGTLRGMNLLTGATSDLASDPVMSEYYPDDFGPILSITSNSPWAFLPANQEQTDWRMVDLRTMESLLLSEEIGGVSPEPTDPYPLASNNDAAVIEFDNPQSSTSPSEAGPDQDVSDPSGNILVLDGSLDNRRWTQVNTPPNAFAAPRASLSPDNTLLALSTASGNGWTVQVERVADGQPVADTGIELDPGDEFLVLNDGAGLLHRSRLQLDLVTWDSGSGVETTTLLELDVDEGTPRLYRTADPDVVIVNLSNLLGPAGAYSVDISTGEVLELPSLLPNSWNPSFLGGVPTSTVLAAVPVGANEAEAIVQMIDATTGEVLVESDPINMPIDQLQNQLAVTRVDGTLGFVSVDPDRDRTVVLNATTGESFEMQIPPDAASSGFGLYPTPDGTLVTPFNGTQWVSWESGESFLAAEVGLEPEWVEVPAGAMPVLITGSHGLSEERSTS